MAAGQWAVEWKQLWASVALVGLGMSISKTNTI